MQSINSTELLCNSGLLRKVLEQVPLLSNIIVPTLLLPTLLSVSFSSFYVFLAFSFSRSLLSFSLSLSIKHLLFHHLVSFSLRVLRCFFLLWCCNKSEKTFIQFHWRECVARLRTPEMRCRSCWKKITSSTAPDRSPFLSFPSSLTTAPFTDLVTTAILLRFEMWLATAACPCGILMVFLHSVIF